MTARRRTALADQRGVTLIELLIVVAIGGLLAVPVAGWVISTIGHQDASQHLLRNAVGTGRLASAMSRDIASANAVLVNAEGDCTGGGEGAGGEVIMAVTPSSAPGQIIYTQADTAGGSDLQSIWRRVCDAEGKLASPATELFERVVPGTASATCLAGGTSTIGDCKDPDSRRLRFRVTPCPTRPAEAARQCDPALGSTSGIELHARRRITPGFEQYSGNGSVAQIQTRPRVGYLDTDFTFDASASSGIDGTTVTWTFPDGSTATGATATKRFSSVGEHEVRLTLAGSGGPTSAVATVRVVNRYPVARATATQTDTGFDFDGSGSIHPDGLPMTYHWDFGGGVTATGAQVSRTFAELGGSGRRRAVLWVSDTANADSATVVVDLPGEPPAPTGPIKIDPAPQETPGKPPLVGTVGPGLPTLSVRFSSDEASPGWTWRLTRSGSGEVVATAPAGDFTHTFAVDSHGEYDIARLAADSTPLGEPSAFRVNAAPRAAFEVVTAGPGSATSFVGDGAGGSSDPDGVVESWRWAFGTGGDPVAGPNPTHVYPAPGTYTVTLTVRDSDGAETTFARIVRIPGTPPAPLPPVWSADGVSWQAVPGAEHYRVTMYCGSSAPYVAEVPPAILTVAVPPGYCDGGALWATLQVRADETWSLPARADR